MNSYATKQTGREVVSLRGYYLRILSRWYLIPLGALVGALIGVGIYLCQHVVFAPAREYAAGARLYLEFSPEAAENAQDYYNAWTWKELITSDEILDAAMGELIAGGLSEESQRTSDAVRTDGSAVKTEDDELVLVPGTPSGMLTRAEVLSSVTIRLPSDLRVMMLTVTRHDADSADAILEAMIKALAAFGESNRNFTEIRVLEQTPALLVVTKDQTGRAAILGAVLALIICAFALFLKYAVDDALYDPETCGKRYSQPMLGVLGREAGGPTEQFERELQTGCHAALTGAGDIIILAASADGRESGRLCDRLTAILSADLQERGIRLIPADHVSEASGDAAIVCVPYGKAGSSLAEHILTALAVRKIPVIGLILYDADMRYLKRLYGLR